MEHKMSVASTKKWKDIFTGLMECMGDTMLTVEVRDIGADYRYVADRARTTIGLDEGDKDIRDEYMYKMYRCEHTPIRCRRFLVSFINLPYSIAMHFVRHNQGVIPFVSTGRDDRVNVDEVPTRDRDNIPVRLDMECNAQALINISRKRLCKQAHRNTIKAWQEVCKLVREIDMPLYANLVPDCVYRGMCYEFKTCGYDKTDKYKQDLVKHRINDWHGWLFVDKYNSYNPDLTGIEDYEKYIHELYNSNNYTNGTNGTNGTK